VLIYKIAIRPTLLYGNETWPITKSLADKMPSCEMRMLRYSLNVSLEDRKPNEEITAEARVMPIKDLMKKRQMQWYGHARRRESEEDIRRMLGVTVEGVLPRGRPKQRWCDTINSDLRWLDLDRADAENLVRWRCLVELGIKQKPATRAGPRR